METASPSAGPRAMLPPIGLGLRRPHMADVLARQPVIGFFEVHPENYILDRAELKKLRKVRENYPLSLHGVGLSLGSADGIDERYLAELNRMVRELEPMLVSDHLSWSAAGGAYLNDLLPLPYTCEALDIMSVNVARAQDALGRRILIENPSAYVQFAHADFSETDFLRELVKRTGCALLLDVNNVYVSAANLGFDAEAYIESFPMGSVEEIHLAGHTRKTMEGAEILIDDHGSRVCDAVWTLYQRVRECSGAAATLIEWDSNIPTLETFLDEARKARSVGGNPVAVATTLPLAEVQNQMMQILLGDEPLPPPGQLGLRGQLSVYRNNVRISLSAALEAAFPAALRLVGESYFRQVAREFVRRHPPAVPSIAAYGAGFPEFIGRAPGAESLVYLTDLARLDWLVHQVSLHDIEAALSPQDLAHSAGRNMPEELTFEVQPAIGYLSSRFPVDKIWAYARAADECAPPPRLADGPAFVELFNDGATIRLRTLDEAVFAFRSALARGERLGDAASRARETDPFFDLSDALRAALRDGIFTRCSMPARQKEEALT